MATRPRERAPGYLPPVEPIPNAEDFDLPGLTVSAPPDLPGSAEDDDDLLDVERERIATEQARLLAPAPRLDVDAGKTKAGKWTSATDAPLASATHGTPAVESWRVWLDQDGARVYLGILASHATPEALIRKFPNSLPAPGESALYVLRGLSPDGKDIPGVDRPFRLSGNAPDVIAARARATPTTAQAPAPSPLEAQLAQIMERQQRLADEALAEARAEAKRAAARVEEERRELADRARVLADSQAQAQADLSQRLLSQAQAQHEMAMAAERERHRQMIEAQQARAREEREERERRDSREREERIERERERERAYEREREREREHLTRLAQLQAASSLESTVGKVGALTAALGINVPDLVGKLLGGNVPEAPVMGEGTAAAIAGVVGKLVETVGNVATAHVQAQAQAAALEETEAPTYVRRVPMPAPRALPAPRPAPAPAPAPASPAPRSEPLPRADEEPEASPSSHVIPTSDPALKDVPMPIQRKARLALRDLADRLRELPEDKWQGEIIATATKSPSIIAYAKAVGIRRAALEAGMDEATAAKLEERAKALGVA